MKTMLTAKLNTEVIKSEYQGAFWQNTKPELANNSFSWKRKNLKTEYGQTTFNAINHIENEHLIVSTNHQGGGGDYRFLLYSNRFAFLQFYNFDLLQSRNNFPVQDSRKL